MPLLRVRAAPHHAARIFSRKRLTSARSVSDWRPSCSAEASTCAAAAPVSPAARLTPAMFAETCSVPLRRLLRVARDLLRRRPLLLHRAGDRRRDLVDLADRAADPLDRRHRLAGHRLDRADLRRDVLGRLRRLVGQRLDLGRHHREALAGIAGARRLDRRVERQQVGLAAMSWISCTTWPIFCAASASVLTVPLVRCACSTACRRLPRPATPAG